MWLNVNHSFRFELGHLILKCSYEKQRKILNYNTALEVARQSGVFLENNCLVS